MVINILHVLAVGCMAVSLFAAVQQMADPRPNVRALVVCVGSGALALIFSLAALFLTLGKLVR